MQSQNDYKRKEELKYLIPQVKDQLQKKYPELVSILDLDRIELECIHDIYWNFDEIYKRDRILLNLIVYKKKGYRRQLSTFEELDAITVNDRGPKIHLNIINDKGQESTKVFDLGDGDDRGAVLYSKGNKAYIWLRWWSEA